MNPKSHMQQIIIMLGIAIVIVVGFSFFQTNRVISLIQNNEAQKVGGQENYELVKRLYDSEGFKQQQKANIEQALGQIDKQQGTQPSANNQANENTQKDDNSEIKTISLDQINKIRNDAYIIGNKNAKILIVEYSDLQCPFCKRHFESKTLETLINKYDGKVAKTMRQFPLGFHQYAQKAGEGAECFADGSAEKYFEFIGEIFAKDLNSNGNDQTIYEVNKELGGNEVSFKICVESGKYTQKIKDQMEEGSSLFGITGTPGNVIINTESGEYTVLAGAYPINQFEEIINKLMK